MKMSMKDRYATLASIYTSIEFAYSLAAIQRAKRDAITHIRAGDRVLILGCGTAEELSGDLTVKAEIHLLDQSPAMLQRVPEIQQINAKHLCDVFDFHPKEPYDLIIAPFFFNVFKARDLLRLLNRLAYFSHLKTRLCVVDFLHPQRVHPLFRPLQGLYWWFPMSISARITGEPCHPPFDYIPILKRRDWQLEKQKRYSFCGLPFGYESLSFVLAKKSLTSTFQDSDQV
jgi:trans-aconitate methyltransferase